MDVNTKGTLIHTCAEPDALGTRPRHTLRVMARSEPARRSAQAPPGRHYAYKQLLSPACDPFNRLH